ncbi:solute carrier family 23 protein [Massilibacteroides sp.]|uniref:uracil-xanthine permease family protein n=1 Tax=Massilibacteroides sp. TaxID=2034766 RepID=UPI002613410D|nr:solute carrier family 23 protein [Massilibacteroides sp.]MDD4514699.1 solute carrier family 23 protein [Massilibacteroides sp.]
MKYDLNDKPDWKAMLLYGIQWFIVTLPAIIIMGSVVAKLQDNSAAFQIMYMQKMFIVAGALTVLQVLAGHKLPLIIGPAAVLLISIVSSLSESVSAIYTSIAVGGLAIAVLAYFGIISKLQVLFTQRIIAVILILIAFTLLPTILNLIVGDGTNVWLNFIFAFLLLFGIIITNRLLKGIWKSTTVLLAIVAGSFAYFLVSGFPSKIETETTLSLNHILLPRFEFNIGVLLSFLFGFIALVINELGSVESVGYILKADQMKKRVKKGVALLGLSNILSGGIGIIGFVDYSLSAGVISSSGCASRYTLIPAGIGLVLCALFPSAIGVFLLIPSVVMGVLLFYLMSMQLATGFSLLVSGQSVKSMSDGLTISLPLMVAVLISFAPTEFRNAIPDIIRPVIANGFVMGTITVLLLEHVFFKKENTPPTPQ